MSEETVMKMKCETVTYNTNGGEIKLTPVVSGSEENDKFFKWTPYGQLFAGIVNTSVLGNFIPGQEYTVTIRKAD